MSRPIDAEEQVYWTLVCRFPKSSIQTFIAEDSRRPNLVFERFLNILLLLYSSAACPVFRSIVNTYSVRFDNEEPGILGLAVECGGI